MTKLRTFRVAFRATFRLCKSSFVDGHKARHFSNSSTVADGILGVPQGDFIRSIETIY